MSDGKILSRNKIYLCSIKPSEDLHPKEIPQNDKQCNSSGEEQKLTDPTKEGVQGKSDLMHTVSSCSNPGSQDLDLGSYPRMH